MGKTRARMRAAAAGAARHGAAWAAITCSAFALAWLLMSAAIAKAGPAGDGAAADGKLSLRPPSGLTAPQFAQAEKPKSTRPAATPHEQPRPAKQPGADALLREATEFQKRKIDEAADEVQELNERRKALVPPARHDN